MEEPNVSPGAPDVIEKPSGPRSSRGHRSRSSLVAAAKQIFEEDGFLDARISDISERAGLSHGSFYYYFESKEEIFREVAIAVDEQLSAPLGDVILSPSRVPARDRIREALTRHFESYRAEARILGVIEEVSHYDEPISAMLAERHLRYREQVAESIRQLQRRGMADPELDPIVTAAALGSMSYRFAETWLVDHGIDCSMELAVDQLTRIFVNAMQLRNPDAPTT